MAMSLQENVPNKACANAGGLRKSQAVFYALSFFQVDGFAVPAPAQVTHTVRWLIIERIGLKDEFILYS